MFFGSDIFERISLIRSARFPPWPRPAILSAHAVEGSAARREAGVARWPDQTNGVASGRVSGKLAW